VLVGCVYKLGHSKHIPVIGDSDTRHAVIFGFLDELFDARGAIEHTKLRVIVKV
jgi:hypothetical protein